MQVLSHRHCLLPTSSLVQRRRHPQSVHCIAADPSFKRTDDCFAAKTDGMLVPSLQSLQYHNIGNYAKLYILLARFLFHSLIILMCKSLVNVFNSKIGRYLIICPCLSYSLFQYCTKVTTTYAIFIITKSII